jgi:hypothetical protein
MPRKTVYVRSGDEPLWERAEKLASGNFSAFLTAALREYLAKSEVNPMEHMTAVHGAVTKRLLYVWGSQYPDGKSAWGTSFDTMGSGPEQAAALVERMKRDPNSRNIQLEERRVYADNSVDREPLEEWTRDASGWRRAR